MAHPVTIPALQRARRLLDQRVSPRILSGAVDFHVLATQEWFVAPDQATATASPLQPFSIGDKWGRAWHTRWFRATTTVPPHLDGCDIVAHFDLGFIGSADGFQVEAMVWRDGRRVHALQPDRRLVHLGKLRGGDEVELWIEAAATPVITGSAGHVPTPFGDPDTAPIEPIYRLRTAQLAAFSGDMASFALDLHTTIDLVIDLESNSPQRARIFAALERCDKAFDVNDEFESLARAHAEIREALAFGAGATSHTVVAVGHAHLDTAWLWPVRETRRKAMRTFANAVHLLERNPDMVYCHSQAQHYDWVAQDDPELFARIVELVREGRWEPVGGMWVETDLNLPSGESLLRQLVHGQRAFDAWFGHRSRVAFLPDDFGYPGGLPQIVAHGGCEFFFTQKLSWNETNRFPHHSFWWEGIDGTAVFAHFSPIDTYNALLTPSQLRFAERNFADHAGATMSLALYGHGDGGGGPTQAMVDRARLATNLESVPRVEFDRVEAFFDRAMGEYGTDAPRWVGEMYFEKHRGTYSTQVGTKQGNRASEKALHEVEVWSAALGQLPGPIDELWQRVLTQQFHDIIPGSSIAWVHHDAETEHADIVDTCEAIIADMLGARATGAAWIANPAPVALHGVIDSPRGPLWCDAAPFSFSEPVGALPDGVTAVSVDVSTNEIRLSNGLVSLVVHSDGTVGSITGFGRDIIPNGMSARFELRNDTPAEYDAWDIDRVDADSPALPGPEHLDTVLADDCGPLSASVLSRFRMASSTFVVRYTVRAGTRRIDVELDAEWHESERRLQWVLPTDLLARDAVCGTQFGHVRRARHGNTSWDHARFEVCAHRYVAVSEPGFGAAILADGPRGYDVRGNELKLTLLRSPHFPDPRADLGHQHLEWSVMPTAGDPILSGIEEEAALMAHPARTLDGAPSMASLGIDFDVPGALVSTLKPADDGSGDLIVRVWETRGARTAGTLTFAHDAAPTIVRCNALEEPLGDEPVTGFVELRPFEIATLRVTR